MAQSLSNLPIGSKVKFGTATNKILTWYVATKNHYDNNSVTLFSEKVVDYLHFDATEPNNPDSSIAKMGQSRYSLSNIRQWLNSRQTPWFTAQHEYDAVDSPMANRSAFGFLFTDSEYNAIKSTTIKTQYAGERYETTVDKIFLPSCSELNLIRNNYDKVDTVEGASWGFPTEASKMIGYCRNDVAQEYGLTAGAAVDYWVRTSSINTYIGQTVPYYFQSFTSTVTIKSVNASNGIRPALNLPSTLSISDTTDSDGYYTFIFNSAPPVPTTLNVPTIYGGKAMSISWGKVTDPDGDVVTYQLESSVNGGEFTTIYSGTNLSYNTSVAYGSTSVQFRLKAIDSQGASSGYISSTSRTVINNIAPVILEEDGSPSMDRSLGEQNIEFTQTYKIEDAESNTVTVTEAIDGVEVRSYVVTLGAINTFSVTGNTWVKLANGNHTMTITATDGIDSSTRTYTFVKSVSSLMIQTSPMVASTRPTRIKVSVTKTIPPAATFKIEVCNNGYASDDNKVWEDATSAMNSGLTHLFDNTDLKDSSQWGVIIRVTVNRNGGSGECHVSAIGGNFE